MQKKILALLLRSGLRYRFRSIAALTGSAMATISSAFLGPYVISLLLTKLQTGTVTLENSIPLILTYAATQLYGEMIGWRINLYLTWTFETLAQKDLYEKIFTKLTSLSMSFHANRFSGALVSQTSKLVGSFERFWDTLIFSFVPSITSIITAVTILSFVLWQYALILLVLSVLFIIAVFFGSKFMAQRNTAESQASTKLTASVADVVTNILTIKAHGTETHELQTFATHATSWRAKSLSSMRGFLMVSSVYSALMATINTSAVIVAIIAAQHHVASIATIYLAISYTLTVSRQLWEINSVMRNYNRIIGDAHDMTEILQTPDSVVDRTSKELVLTSSSIAFNNVTFAHDAQATSKLFSDFSLTIPAGQKVGIVGHSGSGKTTLTKLLLRFSDVDSGTINIGNQSIADVTQASLRRAIAYVPQEPLLFHRTLRENIAYGKPDASDKEVREAARKAHALEFIESLPDGFETSVGERGVKLSGGQRQRIVIARAILKEAPILVLDEATSALDSESERLIQASFSELMKDRTAIVIAHRLSTIQKMDRIIVLENGRITEDGSHADLLSQKGTYAKLWAHQSGGFIEE